MSAAANAQPPGGSERADASAEREAQVFLEVEVVGESPLWDAFPEAEDLALRAAHAAFAAKPGDASPDAPRREVCIALTDDAGIRVLNRTWRGQDKPTNVLSFPAPATPAVPGGSVPLGDVIVAFETLAREAKAEGKALSAHFQHLVVHGVLHLIGHDHEDEVEAQAMEDLERGILAGLGLPDPYREAQAADMARA